MDPRQDCRSLHPASLAISSRCRDHHKEGFEASARQPKLHDVQEPAHSRMHANACEFLRDVEIVSTAPTAHNTTVHFRTTGHFWPDQVQPHHLHIKTAPIAAQLPLKTCSMYLLLVSLCFALEAFLIICIEKFIHFANKFLSFNNILNENCNLPF